MSDLSELRLCLLLSLRSNGNTDWKIYIGKKDEAGSWNGIEWKVENPLVLIPVSDMAQKRAKELKERAGNSSPTDAPIWQPLTFCKTLVFHEGRSGNGAGKAEWALNTAPEIRCTLNGDGQQWAGKWYNVGDQCIWVQYQLPLNWLAVKWAVPPCLIGPFAEPVQCSAGVLVYQNHSRDRAHAPVHYPLVCVTSDASGAQVTRGDTGQIPPTDIGVAWWKRQESQPNAWEWITDSLKPHDRRTIRPGPNSFLEKSGGYIGAYLEARKDTGLVLHYYSPAPTAPNKSPPPRTLDLLVAFPLGVNASPVVLDQRNTPESEESHRFNVEIVVTAAKGDAIYTDLIEDWNRLIAECVADGINAISDSRGFSFVPTIALAKALAYPTEIRYVGSVSIGQGSMPILAFKGAVLDPKPFDCTVKFKSAITTFGTPLQANVQLSFAEGAGNAESGFTDGTFASIIVRSVRCARQSVIQGALECVFSGEMAQEPQPIGRFRFRLLHALTGSPVYPWQWVEARDKNQSWAVHGWSWWPWSKGKDQGHDFPIHIPKPPVRLGYVVDQLQFPVESVQPVGQDPLPSDLSVGNSDGADGQRGSCRRSAPVVLPILDATPTGRRFTLAVTERAGPGESLEVKQELRQESDGGDVETGVALRAIVLDSEPFLAAEVVSPALRAEEGGDGSRRILTRSLEAWQILAPNMWRDGFTLVLPAQGLGEAAVRGRDGDPQIPNSGPLDFRLSPPAVLKLIPSPFEKRYVEPPWNLRRLLGYPGQRDPGVGISQMDFELLYGLACRIDGRPDDAGAPVLRLAELASRIGDVPPPPGPRLQWQATEGQRALFLAWLERFKELYRSWMARVAVLEPWHPLIAGAPELTDGVAFRFRVDKGKKEGDSPIGAQLLCPVKNPPGEIARFHSTNGLAGGATWGFESAAVYAQLWRNDHYRRSSSGKVKGLAFSTLGGWGRQEASFVEGKTKIQSVTAMGRTHVYAVERIGRIAVLWAKAKHVVVYERSSVPSEQFATGYEGRPILRKMQEYVEILEPERRYPDFPDDPLGCAFVTGCRFRSKVIPVHASWGRDIVDESPDGPASGADKLIGWEIPLWNPLADPGVYPRPQVQFEVSTDPATGHDRGYLNIANPQNLHFYTDTRDTVRDQVLTDDVHAWPPVAEVDYTNCPEPEIGDIEPARPDDMDAILPDGLAVAPGFERFTFQLEPSECEVDLIGHQGRDACLNAKLRNVTLMRSRPAAHASSPTSGDNDLYVAAQAAADSFVLPHASKPSLLDRLANGGSLPDDSDAIWTPLQSLHGKLHEAAGPAPSLRFLQSDDLRPKPKNAEPNLNTLPAKFAWNETLVAVDDFLDRVIAQIDGAFQPIEEAIADLGRAKPAIDAAREALKSEIDLVEAAIDRIRFCFPLRTVSAVQPIEQAVHTLTRRAVDRVAAILDEVSRIIDAVETECGGNFGVEKTNLKDGCIKLLAGAKRQVMQICSSGDDGLFKRRLRNLAPEAKDLSEALKTLESDIGCAEAALSQIIDAIPESPGTDIHSILAPLRAKWSECQHRLLARLEAELGQVEKKIFEKICETTDKVQRPVDDAVKAFRDQGATGIKKMRDALENTKVEIGEWLGIVKTAVSTEKNTIEENVSGNVVELLKNPTYAPILTTVDGWLQNIQEWFLSLSLLPENGFADAIKGRLASTTNPWGSSGVPASIRIHQELGRLAGEARTIAREARRTVAGVVAAHQEATQAFRTVRAWCDSPKAQGLVFNRDAVALVIKTSFATLDEQLQITPCVARFKHAGKVLNELGLRVPTSSLADRLVPARLENFDFSKILSDIGGIEFAGMFPGFRLPPEAGRHIRVTHGIDRDTQRAWAKARFDLPLGDENSLMQFGPLEVRLRGGRARAQVDMDADPSGHVRKTGQGELVGDWDLIVSGTPLLTFGDVRVVLREGTTEVKIDPRKVRMPGVMQMLTDLTQAFAFEDEGFRIGLVTENAIPVGARADLELPPFGVGAGTTAVSNIQFGAFIELRALDENLRLDFSIGLGAHFSRRDHPFNLAVFFLGGAGWFDIRFLYKPKSRALTLGVSIGVSVSAALVIDLSVITGGAFVFLGVACEYDYTVGKPGNLELAIFLRIIGEFLIISLIRVSLNLLLEVAVQGSGDSRKLLGRGRVSIVIRITKFLPPYRIDEPIEFDIAGSGASGTQFNALAAGQPPTSGPIVDYINSLEF